MNDSPTLINEAHSGMKDIEHGEGMISEHVPVRYREAGFPLGLESVDPDATQQTESLSGSEGTSKLVKVVRMEQLV